jgi:hypothetical protein
MPQQKTILDEQVNKFIEENNIKNIVSVMPALQMIAEPV